MAQNESEIRYLTPPTVEVKKKKYCRFKKAKIKFNLSDVLMPDEKYNIFDIWAKKELGKFKNSFTAEVEPHSAVLIKIYN